MSNKKVWFITGAGRGMGVDFARAALEAGDAVVASGRDSDRVSKALGQSRDLLAVKLDVTSRADAEAAARAAVDRFGRIDVLVNNAASFYAGYFEELTPEQMERVLEIAEWPAIRRPREARASGHHRRKPGAAAAPLHCRRRCHPLVNPTAHGGTAADAFHVVIPSMPGYGFSGKPATTGWDPTHIARAWAELMKRLGYERYVAQGGDWGAVVVDLMGVQAPKGLLAIHTNMPGIFPADIDGAAFSGAPAPSGLSGDEKVAYERLQFVYQKGIAYGFQMGLRPQTLYGIADSPVGLAAYFLDHDARSYELIARVFDGQSEGLRRDDILDNITITWLTNTALSGARLYWEYWGKGYFDSKGVSIPVAVSVFPDELYPAPRSWAERAYPKLIHHNKLPKGGHFAAWEQPGLLTAELRAGFKSLR
jgi:NAD(P)-dependent dehydrogenase (short-subunit alcohol dehydrogenase family)